MYCQAVTVGTFVIFTFEDWNLFDDSDAWADATCGTIEEKKRKLADPARRAALIEESAIVERGAVVTSFRDIVVMKPVGPDLARYKDQTLGEIADERGCHPVDAMLDIAIQDDLRSAFYFEPPVPDDLMSELVTYPYAVYGVSDGGAHTKFSTGGRYPTETIVKFVRDKGMVDLEEAHWHLSGLPAFCAGLADRGTLREGNAADLVVYDYDRLEVRPPEVVHDLPGGEWRRVQRGAGYRYVMVNGAVTIQDDKETGATAGVLLRNGKSPDRR
jgi:N-acyl-D-aspartate/D-glutamate deacylase